MRLFLYRDMNKSHNMSQIKVTLPVTIEIARHLLKRRGNVDPWELRDSFLSWPAENWKAFGEIEDTFRGEIVTKERFAMFQNLFREALVLPAKRLDTLLSKYEKLTATLLAMPLTTHFDFEGEIPVARISVNDEIQAMMTTIKLDKLLGAEFRVCARADCTKPPFRLGKRLKEYCSYDCAHLVAVRRNRERAAEAKRVSRGKTVTRHGRG
jgi:hypothetical protein